MSTTTPEKKASATVNADAQKPRKGRSPTYPAVALDKAIEMSRKIWDSQRKQEAHVDSALRALGYTTQSGPSLRAISAVKQYGLIVDSGDGDNRKIKLSDIALDILHLPDADSRKVTALRTAALAPTIHAALWERYGAILPADESIIPFLVRDRNYHDDAATDIVANYRSTFVLAKLDKKSDTKLEPDYSGEPDGIGSPGRPSEPQIERKMHSTTQEMPLPINPEMVARIPFPMTEEDFGFLLKALELYKNKLVKSIDSAPKAIYGNPN